MDIHIQIVSNVLLLNLREMILSFPYKQTNQKHESTVVSSDLTVGSQVTVYDGLHIRASVHFHKGHVQKLYRASSTDAESKVQRS